MIKTIYFDMDGTLFDFYGVEDWLPKLRRFDPSPYTDAKPMLNMRVLARYLNRLQRQDIRIGIITWLSAQSNPNYDEVVRTRKARSLAKHLGSVKFDEVHMIRYGCPKHHVAKDKGGILFDDNAKVREAWSGEARTEKEIISRIKELLV